MLERRGEQLTVKEIAKLAQVSPATVSLVLNGKEGVGADTRQKIMDIVENVGYVHKPKQTELKQKNHGTKGTIRFIKYKNEGMLVERNGDFITKIIDGVESAARTAGLSLKITNVKSDNFQAMIESINQDMDDGIIFLGTEFPEKDIELLLQLKAPVVVVDNEMSNCSIDTVVMNNQQAVFTAIQYLKSLGHRDIGHIRSSCRIENFRARDFGYHKAMNELGCEVKETFTVDVAPDLDLSYNMMLAFLEKAKTLPTAFFADNDILAIGALRALKRMGKKIPEDISIIGLDDLMLSSITEPKLTTLKIFKKCMGELAVRRVVEKMTQCPSIPYKILTGSQLIIRESTGILHI